jgi:hypothetical protein
MPQDFPDADGDDRVGGCLAAGTSTARPAARMKAARTIRRSIDKAGLGAERCTDLFQVMDSVPGHLP